METFTDSSLIVKYIYNWSKMDKNITKLKMEKWCEEMCSSVVGSVRVLERLPENLK